MRWPDRLDEAWRPQHRRSRLWRLGLLGRDRGFLGATLGRRGRLRKHVAARQRDVALPCDALDKRSRDDLFDRARCALQLDAVIALEQREHFLAGGTEKLGDLVNPDCCQLYSFN